MSYDEHDAALDEMYDRIGQELYADHKSQAIEEFAAERLRSFYLKHPEVMRPAINSYQEAKALHEANHYSAALVFFATSIELFLKATLLKPVVYGLVHNDNLADVIVQYALGQSGFDRYKGLLAQLFTDIAEIDLNEIKREGGTKPLLEEALDIQKFRNKIIHLGASCTEADSALAKDIAALVFGRIVVQMFNALGLNIHEKGLIKPV
ncbi:MAG: hypothetical protein Q7U10_06915 [Thermodesulfovibrionia bacterium]|nr:hypothetical protein [Thermodesulfovibrionia bacterium]